MRLKWDKQKQSRRVNNWMKVIFSDKSRISFGVREADSNKIYKDDSQKKTNRFPEPSYGVTCHLKGLEIWQS